MSHRFILCLIALAYVALPFCVHISDIIACFIRTKLFHMAQMASSCASAAESSVSMIASTTGSYEPDQMQVQSPSSPSRSDTFSPYTFLHDNTNIHNQELIPQTSRLSRLPSNQLTLVNTTSVAISASYTNSTQQQTSHDVHDFVNSTASLTSSPATRTYGQFSNLPETSVSSSSQLLTNHVINHPIRRPRTHTKVFQSSKDLAAHYGIPEILPPTPRTTHHHQPTKSPIIDFHTLSSNYLSMLSRNPSDNTTMTEPVAPLRTSVSPEELTAPVIPDTKDVDVAKSLPAMLGTESSHDFCMTVSHHYMESLAAPESDVREMVTPSLVDDYSPWSPDVMNPFLSTPQDSTMDTPLFHYLDDSQMLTGPDYEPLFLPMFPEWEEVQEPIDAEAPKSSVPALDPSSLIVMTPTSPLLDSFDPSQLSTAPAPCHSFGIAKATAPRRKVTATGIRKGVTPETLLDESAPTQSRNYITPSATSRKEVPAVFARKRARSTAFGDEEDQLDDYVLPPNPTEKDLIEQKRRQNTVAARRSRKRKLEHLQLLETSLEKERQEKEQWRERAMMLSSILSGLNQPVPDFTANDS